MKLKFAATLLLVIFTGVAFAQSPPPSEASINELLKVMNARAAIDNVAPQMQAMMKNSMQQALNGKTPTPEQQKVMDEMLARMSKLYTEEMSWENMQPLYQRIYQASFTQEEVNGMLKFYRSPPGQALIKKMPVVMQNTMVEMQKMMRPMMEKAQAAAREAQASLAKANENSNDANKSESVQPKK